MAVLLGGSLPQETKELFTSTTLAFCAGEEAEQEEKKEGEMSIEEQPKIEEGTCFIQHIH